MTTPIATGRRQHYVSFERRTVASRAADGSPTYTWITLSDQWAEVVGVRGDETGFGGQIVAESTHKITFPYVADLTTEDRVRYCSRLFGIKYLEDRDFAGVEHVALVKELVD